MLAVTVAILALLVLTNGCASVPTSIATNAVPFNSIVVHNDTSYLLKIGDGHTVRPGQEFAVQDCVPDKRGNVSLNISATKMVMLGDVVIERHVGECKKNVAIEPGGPGHIVAIVNQDF